MRFHLRRFVKCLMLLGACAVVFLLNVFVSMYVIQYRKFMEQGIAEVGYDASGYNLSNGSSFEVEMVSVSNKTKHVWMWPDTEKRLKKCAKRNYFELGPLPSISVVITFISRENISTLLHTVHSIKQRTPSETLKEIILIDDNSEKDDHDEILSLYTKAVFGDLVKIYRFNHNIGLIKARLFGFRKATSEVVVSMDSHMEVQPLWVEPLLYELKKNPKTLAASGIDWMRPIKEGDYRWTYSHGGWYWKTYFDWTLVFGYQTASIKEQKGLGDITQPLKSPVTVGTIFAIRKDFFQEIGEFDEGMELWGGENLDLPIRVWMCGGRVINCPCSRAAHLEYKGNRDYRKDWDPIIERNYKRFITVWMPEYVDYFYIYYPELKHADAGDVSSRMKIKDKCRPDFKWYFREIFPELGFPFEDSLALGGVKNMKYGTCIDTRFTLRPQLDLCNALHPKQQAFYWDKNLRLRTPMHAFNPIKRDGSLVLEQREITEQFYGLPELTTWIHWKGGPLYAKEHNLCLEATSGSTLSLESCNVDKPEQQWTFIKYQKAYEELMSGQKYVQKYKEIASHMNSSNLRL